jgi:hypothetical protein
MIKNKFTALENLEDNGNFNTTWDTITEKEHRSIGQKE